jgi:hypothetical protein
MGFVMEKHNNNTIVDHTIVNNNSNERYLSNSQVNMIEMHECGLETSNVRRSSSYGVRVNYCFKCSHTSSYLADINSCKYDMVSISSNEFTMDFHTYTDSSCSVGDINQFFYNENLNVCNVYGYKSVYTSDFQYDVSIPGLNRIEYSDTSCSTPFAVEIMGIIKESCMQSGTNSIKVLDCTNNILQYRIYSTTDCSGNVFYDDTEQEGICVVPTLNLIWYEDISSDAIIDYSIERIRDSTYCSSLYSINPTYISPSPAPSQSANTQYPGCPYYCDTNTIGDGVCNTYCNSRYCNYDGGDCSTGSPTNDDNSATLSDNCDSCSIDNIWIVRCGSFGTPNTDIACSEGSPKFTCCTNKPDTCCVTNGWAVFGLIIGLIFMIACWVYKCGGCSDSKQIAIITAYTPTTSGKELIKTTIKPFQTEVQATPANMEEGIPFTEARIIPVKQKSTKSKRNR